MSSLPQDFTADLFATLVADGIPVSSVSDNGAGANPRFIITLTSAGTQAQLSQAQSVAAGWDTSATGYATQQTSLLRSAAQELATDPQAMCKLIRATGMEIVSEFDTIVATINQLVSFVNGKGASISSLTAPTWQQAESGILNQISSGNAD